MLNKKTVEDLNVSGKKVLVRCDFNVPMDDNGNITDDIRITSALPTIKYLIKNGAKVILMSHLGRPKGEPNPKYSLKPVAKRLSELLNKEVIFAQDDKVVSKNVAKIVNSMKDGDVVLLENTRYRKEEEKNGEDFSKELASLGDLYVNDFILPAGNLREGRSGAERAGIIVVTKCPPNLSAKEQYDIKRKLKIDLDQKLCFTTIAYDTFVFSEESQLAVSEIKDVDKLLLAGIAKPEPFFAYLQSDNDVVMTFPDHHHFTEKDIAEIKNKAQDKKIITTEKDFVRLKGKLPDSQLFYLPIKSDFISGGDDFDKTILNYVGKSSRNR